MTWPQPQFGKLSQDLNVGARSGMVDVFLAPENTLHTADIGRIGAWQYFGAIKEGSAKNDFTRSFYDLATGAPKTIKDSFVTGVKGSLEFNVIEPSALVVATVAGHGGRTPQYRSSSPVATTVAASGSTIQTVEVSSAANLAVGDELAVTVGSSEEYTRIIGIESTSIHVWPVLSAIPEAAAAVKLIDGWMTRHGTSTVQKNAIMTIFNDRDGNQIVTWVKKSRSNGLREDYANGEQEMSIPCAFEAFGYAEAGVSGPVVAVRYDFKSALALSYDAPST